MSKAIILERPLYNILATSLGSYFNSFITFSTLFLVWRLTFSLLFNTLETVAVETPASSATFLIFTLYTTFIIYFTNVTGYIYNKALSVKSQYFKKIYVIY